MLDLYSAIIIHNERRDMVTNISTILRQSGDMKFPCWTNLNSFGPDSHSQYELVQSCEAKSSIQIFTFTPTKLRLMPL